MSDVKIGIIGGTGLGELLARSDTGQRHESQTPFGPPSDVIVETELEGLTVFLLSRHGPGHLIPPGRVPFRANLFALKHLGCTHIIASGAVGSLRQEMKPRDLVIPDQVIDKTLGRPGTFYEKAAVHVEFAEPFCPVLRRILLEEGAPKSENPAPAATTPVAASAVPAAEGAAAPPAFSVHDRGCYVCMEGPAFSTRAESLMHRLWGGDLIGMTAMPEAKLAREAEMGYALVALVTDYDCWKQVATPPWPGSLAPAAPAPLDPMALLKEIQANLESASVNAMALIQRSLRRIAANPSVLDQSPARHALELAIWSDKNRIDPDEIQRLSPLWGRMFPSL